jgi:hypothetical protein
MQNDPATTDHARKPPSGNDGWVACSATGSAEAGCSTSFSWGFMEDICLLFPDEVNLLLDGKVQ